MRLGLHLQQGALRLANCNLGLSLGPPSKNKQLKKLVKYRTRAIISRGLYIFYPIFKDHFFVFKEVF
jgi:hypothetical protein